MKAKTLSQIIRELQDDLVKHGDIPVVMYDDEYEHELNVRIGGEVEHPKSTRLVKVILEQGDRVTESESGIPVPDDDNEDTAYCPECDSVLDTEPGFREDECPNCEIALDWSSFPD